MKEMLLTLAVAGSPMWLALIIGAVCWAVTRGRRQYRAWKAAQEEAFGDGSEDALDAEIDDQTVYV